jgi:hypothetical protein
LASGINQVDTIFQFLQKPQVNARIASRIHSSKSREQAYRIAKSPTLGLSRRHCARCGDHSRHTCHEESLNGIFDLRGTELAGPVRSRNAVPNTGGGICKIMIAEIQNYL